MKCPNNLKAWFLTRRRPGFESSVAGAEAAQLEKVERCRRTQRQRLSTPSTDKVSSCLGIYYRIFVCLVIAGVTLYAFIDKQNQVTEVRLAIPLMTSKVKKLQEENSRLHYEIDRFESPIHLMELASKSEFGHLKYPYMKDVMIIPEDEN